MHACIHINIKISRHDKSCLDLSRIDGMPDGPGLKHASIQQSDTCVCVGVLLTREYMSICSRCRVRIALVWDRCGDGMVSLVRRAVTRTFA